MSRRKDKERAEGGSIFRNEGSPTSRSRFVCAHCHKPGFLLLSGKYYFHEKCPKEMVPFQKQK